MNSYPIIAQTPTVVPLGIQQETPEQRILRLNGLQGDPRESLKKLEEEAAKHRDWRDGANKIFRTDPKSNPDAIKWEQREFDGDGRVKVTNFDKLIGRSQPELQAAWEKFRRQQLKKEFGGAYLAEKGKILKPDERSNPETVQREIQAEIDRKRVTEAPFGVVTSMSGYREGMLPERPTLAQINQLITKLEPHQQSTIDAQRQFNSDLKDATSSRGVQKQQVETLKSQAIDAARQTSLAEWQAKATNAYNQNLSTMQQYNADEDRRLREAQQNQTMQLAIMGQEDRAEDRRFNREDRREDRQMMMQQMRIKMLIESLNSLGQAFQL